MKKVFLTAVFIFAILAAGVFGQSINEFGITVDYEITEQNLTANFVFDGLSDKYNIHIFMDNEVDSYGSIGFVTISYHNNNGYRGANYFMATNSIDGCCNAILDNLRNNTNRPVINSRIRNKSNEIIVVIRRLLVEALQSGKVNLTQ
jgi:hypothetical protein